MCWTINSLLPGVWTVHGQEVVVLHQEVVDQEVSAAARTLCVWQQHAHRTVLTHTHCVVLFRQLNHPSFDCSTAYSSITNRQHLCLNCTLIFHMSSAMQPWLKNLNMDSVFQSPVTRKLIVNWRNLYSIQSWLYCTICGGYNRPKLITNFKHFNH